jgi:hypothetical protein
MSCGGESMVADWADEISFDSSTLSGSYQSFGSLAETPVHLIIDNQSDTPIELSINGTSTCKTFAAGQSVILDLSTNRGNARDFTFVKGKPFWVKGTAGTGDFLISYTYRVWEVN